MTGVQTCALPIYRADDYACLEFADCLEAVCERLNVDSDIIPDLRAKNRKKTGQKGDEKRIKTGIQREI